MVDIDAVRELLLRGLSRSDMRRQADSSGPTESLPPLPSPVAASPDAHRAKPRDKRTHAQKGGQ